MSFKIVILSDSHIFASREKDLFGVDTSHSLAMVTNEIRGSGQNFDLMVASGDLSEDGNASSYEYFHELTGQLAHSSVWMKGNHDAFDSIPADLMNTLVKPDLDWGPWSIIFLDTSLAGRDEGELGEQEVSRLEAFLQENSENYKVIFMHHQPIEVDSDFIDLLGLQNKQLFWEIISRYRHIKAVVFGHVHQEYDEYYHGIRLLSTPATSVQFKPRSHDLEFDIPSHAYRTITLHRDGSLRTNIHRIASSG